MRSKRTVVFEVVALLLIGSLMIVGCGSSGESQQNAPSVRDGDLRGVCADEVVPEATPYTQTSGIHPLVVARKVALGWRDAYADYTPPPEWRADAYHLEQAELVVCIEEEQTTVEECPYTLAGGKTATLYRVQVETVVTLREAQTGNVVATSKTMKGGLPAKCQASEQFASGSTSKIVKGATPEDAVNDWLKQYVEIP